MILTLSQRCRFCGQGGRDARPLPAPVEACSRSPRYATTPAGRARLTSPPEGRFVRFAPVEPSESATLPQRGHQTRRWHRAGPVPHRPRRRHPLHGRDVLLWARQLIDAAILDDVVAAAAVGTR